MKARAVRAVATPARKPVRVRRPARTWRERMAEAPPRRKRRTWRSEVGVTRPRLHRPRLLWQAGEMQGSRLAAMLFAGVLVLVMAQLVLNDVFYVYRLEASGARRLNEAMLFEQSGAAGYNVFWVDPSAVQQRLLANPWVQAATVQLALPNRLMVTIQEREPRLAWHAGDTLLWADASGALLPPTDEVMVLPRLVDDAGVLRISHTQLSAETVAAVLQLQTLTPDVLSYRYEPDLGLHFETPDGLTVYMGDEQGMREKVALLNALRTQLAAEGTQPQLIDLRYEGNAYYR